MESVMKNAKPIGLLIVTLVLGLASAIYAAGGTSLPTDAPLENKTPQNTIKVGIFNDTDAIEPIELIEPIEPIEAINTAASKCLKSAQ